MKNPTSLSLQLLHPEARRAPPRYRSFSVVGASLGLLAFLFVALLPSLLYGGTIAARLADGIFGAAGPSHVALQVFVALGIVCAVTAVASLFAGLGAVIGASLGVLARGAVPRTV